MDQPLFTREGLRPLIDAGFVVCGAHTYGMPTVQYFAYPGGFKLYIGRYCSIARQVEIFLGGYHRADWVTTYPFPAFELWAELQDRLDHAPPRGDVVIGSDVWIGEGVTVMAGVRIGHGAVIGARAVVTKDVPPYAVVAGNPGQVVKRRFDEATIAALLEIAWWRWPEARVRANLPLLLSGDIAGFIARNRPAAAAQT